MAVRFVIGRAGTGKTRHCVEAIARAVAAAPLGGPLLWIVPDQATFNAERTLVTHPGIGGSFRAQVTSFRRLTHLLAVDLGLHETEDLDDLARVILLGDLVQANRERLALFGPIADRPGFIKSLDAMLRELQQSAHTGATLRQIAGQVEDAILARKLGDLALLLDLWDGEITRRKLPSERLAATVASRLGELEHLRQARVWVDSFSAFNVLEIGLLLALAEHTEGVEITLLGEPLSPAMRDPNAALDEMSLFYRSERVYHVLHKAFLKQGVRVEPNVTLTTQHRLGGRRSLELIERQLFTPVPRVGGAAARADRVEVWECSDPLTEVQAAAQAIKKMISAGPEAGVEPLRYRDIGLIIPALEAYADPIRRIFAHHGIPHFIDQRRPIAHHPLIEFLRTAVALVQNRFAGEDVSLLLKTGLTGVPDAEAHQLENYLLAHGITHVDLSRAFTYLAPNHSEDDPVRAATDGQRAQLESINQTRQMLHQRLQAWAAAASVPEVTGDALTRALYDLLVACEVPGHVQGLIEAARAGKDNELLLIHEQAWRRTVELLEVLERLLAGRKTPLAEYAQILSMALESLTLGLIPPTVDQVLVSSVTRSRHPELKVVFILGAIETRFPLVRPEDPLLNDQQRALFNQHATESIEPGSDQKLIEAQFYDYVAFTRASRRLIVSYPLADERGKAIVKSQYVTRLGLLFEKLEPRRITPEQLHGLENLGTLDDALATTLRWVRAQGSAGRGPDGQATAGLYQWLAGNADLRVRGAVGHVWPALRPVVPPALKGELAGQFYGRQIRLSVSQLEKYAACPLQYFLYYTLGLRERPRMQLDVLELGTLFHRILERVFDRVIAGTLAWPECGQADLRAALEQEAGAAARELHPELAGTTPAYGKVLLRAQRTLGIVLEAQRRAACVGDLRPAATELTFGMRHEGGGARKVALPVLEVATAHGRTGHLSGKVDRVDVDGRHAAVIDYKSAERKQLELSLVYHGLALQLPVYLLVLGAFGGALERGAIRPIASLYVPLQQWRKTAGDLDGLLEPKSDAFYQQHKPRGLIDADGFGHLDATVEGEKRSSDWYAYKRTKGKAPTKRDPSPPPGPLAKTGNDALEHEDFRLVLAFTRQKMAELIDALAEGHIAPRPYRDRASTPCDYCDFTSLCPFDRVRGSYRPLPKMSREETLAAMRETVEKAGVTP